MALSMPKLFPAAVAILDFQSIKKPNIVENHTWNIPIMQQFRH